VEAIATRGNTALVADGDMGVIVRLDDGSVSQPWLVQSILQRGYWIPFEGDDSAEVALAEGALTAAAPGVPMSAKLQGFRPGGTAPGDAPLRSSWDAAKHPHRPAGDAHGGEWAPKGVGPQVSAELDAIPVGGSGKAGPGDEIRQPTEGLYELRKLDMSKAHWPEDRDRTYVEFSGTKEEMAAHVQERLDMAKAGGSGGIFGQSRDAEMSTPMTRGRVTLDLAKVPNAWAVEHGYADYVEYRSPRASSQMGANAWTIKWKPGTDPERVLVHYVGGVAPPPNFPEGSPAAQQFQYQVKGGTKGVTNKAKREAEVQRIMGLTASLVAAGFVFEGMDEPDVLLAAFDESKVSRNPATGRDSKESPSDGGKFKSKKGGPSAAEGDKEDSSDADAKISEILGGKPDTQQRWKPGGKVENGEYVGGKWLPERTADVHVPFYLDEMKNSKRVTDGPPTALFMAGGTASGKDTLLFNQLGGGPPNNVNLDPDRAKAVLPEMKEIGKIDVLRAAPATHEESSEMAKTLTKQALARNTNIVVNGTGDNSPEKFMQKVKQAQEAGYKIEVVMADIPTEIAVARAIAASKDPKSARFGRLPAVDEIRNLHRQVAKNHLVWRDEVDDWQVWATDEGNSRVVAYREGGGKIVVVDKDRYEQALKKAEG